MERAAVGRELLGFPLSESGSLGFEFVAFAFQLTQRTAEPAVPRLGGKPVQPREGEQPEAQDKNPGDVPGERFGVATV